MRINNYFIKSPDKKYYNPYSATVMFLVFCLNNKIVHICLTDRDNFISPNIEFDKWSAYYLLNFNDYSIYCRKYKNKFKTDNYIVNFDKIKKEINYMVLLDLKWNYSFYGYNIKDKI
jgi:hypothetical protein